MTDDLVLTKYQREKARDEQKEFPCGILHVSIEEALIHAERALGIRNGNNELTVKLEPYLGTMRFSTGTIVGWQTSPQKRFRLDFDPEFEQHNRGAIEKGTGVNKGTRGIHVNEEDFTRARRQKVCHPTESSLQIADHYWRKWSSEFGIRGTIKPNDLKR
jgi:hypothetical protein